MYIICFTMKVNVFKQLDTPREDGQYLAIFELLSPYYNCGLWHLSAINQSRGFVSHKTTMTLRLVLCLIATLLNLSQSIADPICTVHECAPLIIGPPMPPGQCPPGLLKCGTETPLNANTTYCKCPGNELCLTTTLDRLWDRNAKESGVFGYCIGRSCTETDTLYRNHQCLVGYTCMYKANIPESVQVYDTKAPDGKCLPSRGKNARCTITKRFEDGTLEFRGCPNNWSCAIHAYEPQGEGYCHHPSMKW